MSSVLSQSGAGAASYSELIVVMALLVAMIVKDIVGDVHGGEASLLGRGLSIVVVPLMLMFAVYVLVRAGVPSVPSSPTRIQSDRPAPGASVAERALPIATQETLAATTTADEPPSPSGSSVDQAPSEVVAAPSIPAASQSASGEQEGPIAGIPTAAQAPLPMPSPTAVSASAPPAGPAPVARATRIIRDERFDEARPGWPNDPRGTAWFADGAYHLAAREPGRFVAVGVPVPDPLGDVAVTGTFRKVGGPPGGGYGLIARDQGRGPRDGTDQGGRYYVFEVGDGGEYGIWRRDEDRWVDIVPWTATTTAQAGDARNELTVHAIGSELIFLVNQTQVARIADAALASGRVGVFAGGDGNEVALERLIVEAIEQRDQAR